MTEAGSTLQTVLGSKREMHPRLLRSLLLCVLAATAVPAARADSVAFADPSAPIAEPVPAPDRILIRLDPAAAALARLSQPARAGRTTRIGVPAVDAAVDRLPGTRLEREFPFEAPPPLAREADLTAFWIVHLPPESARERTLAIFATTPGVERAEPIWLVPVTAVPVDSLWSRAWYFYQTSRRDLHAPEAWSICTGDTSVVIGIVDTGVIPYHPDLGGTVAGLSGNIWTNWAEAGGRPGVDDDGNGYVDDLHGWDFVNLIDSTGVKAGEDWRDEDNDPNDFAGHGTAVAGVAGALTNNGIGVAGTVWNTRIMPLRAGWSAISSPLGLVDLSFAARAILYATRNGASVINCSFAAVRQSDFDAAVSAAIAAGVTVVTGSGNNGSAHGLAEREDVISVAATDPNDKVTLFSDRGDYVDLSAPGASLATTLVARTGSDSLGQRQCTYSIGATGTSFSSPLVAGAVALLQSERRARGKPPLPPVLAQMRVRETADDISALNPTMTGYGDGRLNLLRLFTDPPTSLGIAAAGRSVGAPAVLRGWSGRARVALAMLPGHVVILDGATGDTLRVLALRGAPVGGIAAADLGGGRGAAMFVGTSDGSIEGVDLDGNALPGWPVLGTPAYDGAPVEPALGDLDGDGVLEVLWGGSDGNVWAWHADGRRLAGFPRWVGSPGRNVRLALSDLDGRPGVEIVAAAPSGTVHVLSGDGGDLPGWPIGVLPAPASPAILRSPETGEPEIILAAGSEVDAWTPDATKRWSVLLSAPVAEGPAVGDLDGDGEEEIVLPMSGMSKLQVLGAEGENRSGSGTGWDVRAQPLGPPVIGPVRLGRSGVVVVAGSGASQAHVVALTGSGAIAVGFPKPGRCGLLPALADLDGDGRTEIVAGAGGDSEIYLYDAGRDSWNDAAAIWPTPRANMARTGSRLYAPPAPMFDDVPPAVVSDLQAAEVGVSSVALRWTAPADPGPSGAAAEYDLRRADVPLDGGNFETGTRVNGLPAPAAPGQPDSALVTGLEEMATCYFALRSRDAAGNWSGVSPALSVTTAGDPPAAVRDLRVLLSSDSALTLVWTATGDDGTLGRPQLYLVRGAPAPLDSASFDRAPIRIEHAATAAAGGRETVPVTALERARRYWFALVAVDDRGNRSPLSNVTGGLTGPLGARVGVALAAGAQPARPPIEIFWQGAAGAAGSLQRIRIYDVGGRLRRTLALPATGEGMAVWDGSDETGRAVPAGLYFAQLASGAFRAGTRIAVLR